MKKTAEKGRSMLYLTAERDAFTDASRPRKIHQGAFKEDRQPFKKKGEETKPKLTGEFSLNMLFPQFQHTEASFLRKAASHSWRYCSISASAWVLASFRRLALPINDKGTKIGKKMEQVHGVSVKRIRAMED